MEAAAGHWPGEKLRDYAVAESSLLDQLGKLHRSTFKILSMELIDKRTECIPLSIGVEEMSVGSIQEA